MTESRTTTTHIVPYAEGVTDTSLDTPAGFFFSPILIHVGFNFLLVSIVQGASYVPVRTVALTNVVHHVAAYSVVGLMYCRVLLRNGVDQAQVGSRNSIVPRVSSLD